MGVADKLAGLSASQRGVARIVEQVLGARGLPAEIVAAALVNAHAESGLRAGAVGDSGASIGVFQLHERGAGKGMSVADRQDPVKNTKRIYEVYAGSAGKALRAAYAAGERDVGKLAALWSRDIERPADKAGAMSYRAKLAARLFPAGSGMVVAKVAVGGLAVGWVFAWVAGAALMGTLLWRARAQRGRITVSAGAAPSAGKP